MVKVQIEYEAMEAIASKLQAESDAIQESCRRISGATADLHGQWQSPAASQFFNRAEVLLARYKKLAYAMQLLADTTQDITESLHHIESDAKAHFNWMKELISSVLSYLAAFQDVQRLSHTIDERIAELQANGLDPDNSRFQIGNIPSDQYGAAVVIPVIFSHKDTIDNYAARYGVDPRLLAGVVASEMDFDHAINDRWADRMARHDPLGVYPEALGMAAAGALGAGPGVMLGNIGAIADDVIYEGLGVASVHEDTLQTAIVYLNEHDLPGADMARQYNFSPQNRASFAGSVEAAAIVTAGLTHTRYGNMTPVMDATDMAVIWGGYRTGVEGFSPQGDGFTQAGFRENRIKDIPDGLAERFYIGTNAYMSEPYFDFFIRNW